MNACNGLSEEARGGYIQSVFSNIGPWACFLDCSVTEGILRLPMKGLIPRGGGASFQNL